MNSEPITPSGLQERLSQFRRIQALSLRALEAAQAQDWEEVISLDGERGSLLQALFSSPLPDEIHRALAETLSATLTINQATYALAEEARNASANDLLRFRQRKQAEAAYNDIG